MKSKILVIDDNTNCIDIYKSIFSSTKYEVEYFTEPYEALVTFAKDPLIYSIAFVDHRYAHGDKVGEIQKLGGEIVQQLKKLNPMITACIVSGDGSLEALKSWLSVPMDHYIYKPLKEVEILGFAEHYVLDYEENFLPIKDFENDTFQRKDKVLMEEMGIISKSESMIDCIQKALKFAKSDLNVLLLGETGTGKELLAHGIHKNSEKGHLGFFPINCANYRDNSQLLEVELFGSEKGSFTGAERKAGIFEMAKGGTVFLDEVHHLSLTAQGKLFRVLQEKKIRRIGGIEEYLVKFRVIAAGKPNLKELCKKGEFSPDLYYRLRALDLLVPPLRERKRDIRLLVGSFLQEIKERTGKAKHISSRAMEHLKKYDWPGNVRELQQLIEKLNVVVDENIISPKHLLNDISTDSVLMGGGSTLPDLDHEYEKKQMRLILNVLKDSNYNLTEATRRLGLGEKRSKLRYRMKLLKIKDLSKKDKKSLLHFINNPKGGKHEKSKENLCNDIGALHNLSEPWCS